MIRLIQGSQRDRFPKEIDQMHRLRARVFDERLKWDVTVRDGWEIDRFDEINPLYLLSIDEDGEVRGSLRLLPTTGPNMLRDVFPILLPEGQVIESPTVWESSRFSVDHDAASDRSPNRLSRATGELILGAFEVGQLAGLSHIVSVYDVFVGRVLRRANCHWDPLGDPHRIGRVMAYAGFFEVSDEMIARVREASGIDGSVLEPKSVERLMIAA